MRMANQRDVFARCWSSTIGGEAVEPRWPECNEQSLFVNCAACAGGSNANEKTGATAGGRSGCALEDRRLLATINVTSPADDGSTNTLRWAIGMANTADSPTSIDIELGTAPATITLDLGQLELSNTAQPVTIYDGAGQGPVSINGNNESRVFDVDANVAATLSDWTIAGGSTQANGGGLFNAGTLTLLDCTISGNSALTGAGIYNSRTATLSACTISGNFMRARAAASGTRGWPT